MPRETRLGEALQVFPQSRHSALLAAHCAVLLFGLTGLVGRYVTVEAATIVFARTTFAAAALLIYALLTKNRGLWLERRQMCACGVSGVLLALHWAAFFYSVRVGGVAVGMLTAGAFPVFVTLLEPLTNKERFDRRMLVLCGIVMAGIALVTPLGDIKGTQGVVIGTVAALLFALLTLNNRRFARDVPPVPLALYQNGFAALVIAPFGAWGIMHAGTTDIFALLFLGIACTAVAHVLFLSALTALPARIPALLVALEPVYGIALDSALHKSAPSPQIWLGGAVILGAVVMAGRRGVREKQIVV